MTIGDAVKGTGYYVLMSHDADEGCIWLCPDCFNTAMPLVHTILGIVKSGYVSLNSFKYAASGHDRLTKVV